LNSFDATRFERFRKWIQEEYMQEAALRECQDLPNWHLIAAKERVDSIFLTNSSDLALLNVAPLLLAKAQEH
jgi:hypothetical protein